MKDEWCTKAHHDSALLIRLKPIFSFVRLLQEVSEAECCAVCIEPYKASDVVRLLPCRYVWLI